jgi:hypothetical protein
MKEVAPLIGDVLMRLGGHLHRLCSAMAPLLAPRDPPSAAPQSVFVPAVVAGVQMCCPLARMANDSSPMSMPVSCPVAGNGCIDTSAQEIATHHLSASRLIVIVLGAPSMGRWRRLEIRPILESASIPPSSVAPLPHGDR